MTATMHDIQGMIARRPEGTRWVIIVCDTYDYDNYPVYVTADQDISEEMQRVRKGSMQTIDEVYDMTYSLNEQLARRRAWYAKPEKGPYPL